VNRVSTDSTSARAFRLLIVHDDRVCAQSLALALAARRFKAVDVVRCPEHALYQAERDPPDVVVIDWGLAEKTGYELIGRLKEIAADAKVLVFGMPEDESAMLDSIQAGVAGYALKSESLDDLVVRIEPAVQGEASCSPQIAQLAFGRWAAMTREQRAQQGQSAVQLTQRKLEILGLVDKGLSYKEIARVLPVSPSTVKNHVHHLFEKLQGRAVGGPRVVAGLP
jgi:DNA-binding NarL/FixJ family response regulator